MKDFFKQYDKVLLAVCRLLLAAVFVFSGFVKAIDPLGLTYKIEDYLTAFGGIFPSFSFVAFPLSIFLSTAELLIGLNLLFAIYLRRTSFAALIFMLIVTPLTLYIAIYNPVTDCGCFGDALVISNWQTFGKNVILLGLVGAVIFLNNKKYSVFLPHVEAMMSIVFVAIGLSLSAYCYLNLPLIDFRPYKVGTNIPAQMTIPEGAPADVFTTNFVYEKDGVQKEFTLENYPKDDTTWVFVDQKTKLISKGYTPPIHDFSIQHPEYGDITTDVIEYSGSVYLLVMYDVTKASADGAKKAEEIYQKYKNTNVKFYALTASADSQIAAFSQANGLTFPFCKTDPITLKTVIRANPGLVLLTNGTVVGKWHWRNF